MADWQVSAELATVPPVVETTALEVRSLTFDASALLGGSESITAQATQLTDLETGEVVGLAAPGRSGNVITQVVKGLLPGHDYRLIWTITISATKKPTRITIVRCVA